MDDVEASTGVLVDATSDASVVDAAVPDAGQGSPLDAAPDASGPDSALPDATADGSAQDGSAQDGSTDAAAGCSWVYIGIGDCPGTDRSIGYSTSNDLPVPADCNQAEDALAAVCWDQTTYTNTLVPSSAPGCTYKTIPESSCTGGSHPGYLYVCQCPDQ
jgi:hypothetical protein